MTPAEIISRADALGPWYHELELTPGYVTKSCMVPQCRPQWAAIKRLMKFVNYQGKTVLDLGTMDGAWAFEAERRHAEMVIATDIYQCADAGPNYEKIVRSRFNTAREILESKVRFIPQGDVEDLHFWRTRLGLPVFDLIQCFGVLYHVENPILAFRNLRQCLTKDGLLLIETALWNRDNDVPFMRFNFDKEIYWDSTTFWIPNRKCLEQMLTLTGFRIQPETWIEIEMERANRVCFVAEAV